jgi:hypothetical protein
MIAISNGVQNRITLVLYMISAIRENVANRGGGGADAAKMRVEVHLERMLNVLESMRNYATAVDDDDETKQARTRLFNRFVGELLFAPSQQDAAEAVDVREQERRRR